MTPDTSERQIIFDHLPKTCGTSINFWLRQAFGTDLVTPNMILFHHEAVARYKTSHRVICGHFTFSQADDLDPHFEYITILREPVSRVLSNLLFWAELDGLHQYRRSSRIALEFLSSEGQSSIPADFNNFYVKHFARLGKDASVSEEKAVELALHTLERYSVVGFVDDLGAFLRGVERIGNVQGPVNAPTLNRTKLTASKSLISDKIIRRITSLNLADIAFFHLCRLGAVKIH
jgi:hypothetical protein